MDDKEKLKEEIKRLEQIRQHLVEYPQKFESVVVFSIEDFARTYGYSVEEIAEYFKNADESRYIEDTEISELEYWHREFL